MSSFDTPNPVQADLIVPTRPLMGPRNPWPGQVESHAPAAPSLPAATQAPTVPIASPTQPTIPEVVDVGGVRMPKAEYDALVAGYLRPDRTALLRPTVGAWESDRLRELEAREAAIAEREARLSALPAPPAPAAPQRRQLFNEDVVAKLNEEVPTLGGALQVIGDAFEELRAENARTRTAIEARDREDQRAKQARREDELFDAAMAKFQGKAFYDEGRMIDYMKAFGLGRDPRYFEQHMQAAYDAIAGPLIMAHAEALRAGRIQALPRPMGATSTVASTGPVSPATLAMTAEAKARMPWGSVTRAAMISRGYNPDAE